MTTDEPIAELSEPIDAPHAKRVALAAQLRDAAYRTNDVPA
jgi:hypothetical protein